VSPSPAWVGEGSGISAGAISGDVSGYANQPVTCKILASITLFCIDFFTAGFILKIVSKVEHVRSINTDMRGNVLCFLNNHTW
jgi:hypothetical protein